MRFSQRMTWCSIRIAKRLFFLCLIFSSNAYALYESPVWEVGIAAGYLRTSEYRGAAQQHNYYIPFPYAAYRGHRLSFDEDGIRGQLIKAKTWKLDMRFGANVPVESSESSPRAGMAKLDPVIEMGPSLEFSLWVNKRRTADLWLRTPLRMMTSISTTDVGYQGWSLAPYLEYVRRWRLVGSLWNFGIAVGPMLNSESYHNYFYRVSTDDITASREAYDSQLGYGGSRLTLTLIGNSKNMWYGFLFRYDDLHGAAFIDSPLVETQRYFAYGLSIGWKFLRSNKPLW